MTCIARKREVPLVEMNRDSLQINLYHLQTYSVSVLIREIFLYRLASFDNQNKVIVVATAVLSCAALRTTLVLALVNHIRPNFLQSATATAIDATEAQIVPGFQDS